MILTKAYCDDLRRDIAAGHAVNLAPQTLSDLLDTLAVMEQRIESDEREHELTVAQNARLSKAHAESVAAYNALVKKAEQP